MDVSSKFYKIKELTEKLHKSRVNVKTQLISMKEKQIVY